MPVIEEIQTDEPGQQRGSGVGDINHVLGLLLNSSVQQQIKELGPREKMNVLVQLVNSIGGNVQSMAEFQSVLGLDTTSQAAEVKREPPPSENEQSRDEFSPDSTKDLEMRALPTSAAPADIAAASLSYDVTGRPQLPTSAFLPANLPLSEPLSGRGEVVDFAQLLSRHTGASDVPSSRASGSSYHPDPPQDIAMALGPIGQLGSLGQSPHVGPRAPHVHPSHVLYDERIHWERSQVGTRDTRDPGQRWSGPVHGSHGPELASLFPSKRKRSASSPRDDQQPLNVRSASSPVVQQQPHNLPQPEEATGASAGQLPGSSSEHVVHRSVERVMAHAMQRTLQQHETAPLSQVGQPSRASPQDPAQSGGATQQQVLNSFIMQLTLQQLVQERPGDAHGLQTHPSLTAPHVAAHGFRPVVTSALQPAVPVKRQGSQPQLFAGSGDKGKHHHVGGSGRRGAVFVGGPCDICGATETSQWRNGPQGKRFCNACGVKFRNLTKSRTAEEALLALHKSRSAGPRTERSHFLQGLHDEPHPATTTYSTDDFPPHPPHSSFDPATASLQPHVPPTLDPVPPPAQVVDPSKESQQEQLGQLLHSYLRSGADSSLAEHTQAAGPSHVQQQQGGSARSGSLNSEPAGHVSTPLSASIRNIPQNLGNILENQSTVLHLSEHERRQLMLMRLLKSAQHHPQPPDPAHRASEYPLHASRPSHPSSTPPPAPGPTPPPPTVPTHVLQDLTSDLHSTPRGSRSRSIAASIRDLLLPRRAQPADHGVQVQSPTAGGLSGRWLGRRRSPDQSIRQGLVKIGQIANARKREFGSPKYSGSPDMVGGGSGKAEGSWGAAVGNWDAATYAQLLLNAQRKDTSGSPFEKHLLLQLLTQQDTSSPSGSQPVAAQRGKQALLQSGVEEAAPRGVGSEPAPGRKPQNEVVLKLNELEILGQAIAAQEQAIRWLQKVINEAGSAESAWSSSNFKQMVNSYLDTLQLSNKVLKQCFGRNPESPQR